MTNSPSPRPLSIKRFALALLLSVPPSLINWDFLAKHVLPEFYTFVPLPPYVAFGWSALAYAVLMAGLRLYLGVGLWRLQEQACRIAIGYAIYMIFSSVPILFSSVSSAMEVSPNQGGYLFVFVLVLALGPLLHSAFLWFLITRKAAFGKPRTP